MKRRLGIVFVAVLAAFSLGGCSLDQQRQIVGDLEMSVAAIQDESAALRALLESAPEEQRPAIADQIVTADQLLADARDRLEAARLRLDQSETAAEGFLTIGTAILAALVPGGGAIGALVGNLLGKRRGARDVAESINAARVASPTLNAAMQDPAALAAMRQRLTRRAARSGVEAANAEAKIRNAMPPVVAAAATT